MTTGRPGRAISVLLLLVGALAALGLPLAPHAGAAPAAGGTLAPSRYVPVTPYRAYDSGAGAVGTAPVSVPLGTKVPSTATAVEINLTGDRPTVATDVIAYPPGTSPTTSALNLLAGTTSADAVTVALPAGSDGTVLLHNDKGRIRLIVDVEGYYTAAGAGAPYVPVQPYRAYDSRGHTPLGTGTTTLTAAQLGVPAAATALVANLTAVGPSQATDLVAWPADGDRPPVSDLNVVKGDVRANLVVVALGAGGTGLDLATDRGTTPYLVDVEGWYSPSATGALYTPLSAPVRIFGSTARPGVTARSFDLALPSPVPATATAAAFTLTVVTPTLPTDVDAYPPGASATTSNVNVDKGVTTPNLVVSSLGASTAAVQQNASSLTATTSSPVAVRLTNKDGTVQLVVDLQGWFVPRTPGHDVSANQCSGSTASVPTPVAFGAINPSAGGLAGSGVNPCLGQEDDWASATGDEAFYAPLADRGSSSALYETPGSAPKTCLSGQTPTAYDADAGCAYDYGWNQAASFWSYASTTGHQATDWWLDVEDRTGNWYDGSTAMSTSQDAQVITGAHDYLVGAGAEHVGLYSNGDAANWASIIGSAAGFAAYPEWISTHATASTAVVRSCATPFAAGAGSAVVQQVQDAGGSVDTDYRC